MTGESEGFIRPKVVQQRQETGCWRSKHTVNCCWALLAFGCIFVALGVAVLAIGQMLLEGMILKTMAITPGSSRLQGWLTPPVESHMDAYAFHVTNPDEVLRGAKPILEEKGPFVFRSDTVKDSDDNMVFRDNDTTLTYRQRKIYHFVPEKSVADNLENFYLTVPNIPYWTGLNKARKQKVGKSLGIGLVTGNGLATPFINVSFGGLMWGYNDELPCLPLSLPAGCGSGGSVGSDGDSFGDADFGDEDDSFGFDGSDGTSFGDGGGGAGSSSEEAAAAADHKEHGGAGDAAGGVEDNFVMPEDSEWEPMVKPKAEFVNCKCEWGLFRDRNVTMRSPIRFMTGVGNLADRGRVVEYDGKSTLGWWQRGSTCDQVKGQDASTLPPGLTKDSKFDVFIDLMCRSIGFEFEKEVEHAGMTALRFIPPLNALGAHDDPDEAMANDNNKCYCLEKEFQCFKSGVLNLEPCKRKDQAPIALSMPHFYNADPSFREAVKGMKPDKEKHEFYIDVLSEFGFPLAIQPRFQLNVIMFREPEVPELANLQPQIVLPFLWAQVGFSEPSEAMAEQLKFGLHAPTKLPPMAAGALLALAGGLFLVPLVYFLWQRKASKNFQANGTSIAMT